MRILARTIAFSLLAAAFPHTSWGAAVPQQSIPPDATILTRIAIPGASDRFAVEYKTEHIFLGVARGGSGGDQLIWSRTVPSALSVLDAPGQIGLFRAFINGDAQHPGRVFAYRLNGDSVSSAIAGSSSGWLEGDDGVRPFHSGFQVRVHDTAHVGAVHYRVATNFVWQANVYRKAKSFTVPDYPANGLPVPNATIKVRRGDEIMIRLEIAATEAQRQSGLMRRTSMDPDWGMVFVWQSPVQESFWMENTYIPLSIAFLSADGTVQEMQDMQALSLDLHTPDQAYTYAIEANLGFFAQHGIRVGDRFHLDLGNVPGS